MVIIGIDPAMRKNGFALCLHDTTDNSIDFLVMEFTDFIFYVTSLPEGDYQFCVENSNLQNLSFDMRGNKNIVARKSRNVGMNQAVSQLTCDYLKKCNYKVIELSPKQKGEKMTKETAKVLLTQFSEVNNYKGLVSEQDKRDAFKLVLLAISGKY
jgi:hypothetical protein